MSQSHKNYNNDTIGANDFEMLKDQLFEEQTQLMHAAGFGLPTTLLHAS